MSFDQGTFDRACWAANDAARANKRIAALEKKVAELTERFESERAARRSYKKQLNRVSNRVVKKHRRATPRGGE